MRLPLAVVAFVGLVAAGSFFYRLGAVGLIGPDESSYVEVAREMGARGDWITPHLMGQPWLDKPPALFWAQAASFRALGENELAARLPSAAAALGSSIVSGWLGRRLFGPAAGGASALILATSFGLTVYGRAAIPDALFTFTLTLGLGAYLMYAVESGRAAWLPLAFASFGAAVLAKGPVGLVLPLLQIGLFHGLGAAAAPGTGRRAKAVGLGAASFLIVAAPWHLAILQSQGWAFVEEFLLEHNFDRYVTTVHRHPGPFYFYVPVLLAALFPWSILLPGAASRALRKASSKGRYLLLWAAVPFLFFSLAGSKLPGYVLPVLPPCALLIGADLAAGAKPSSRAWAAHLLVALALAAAILYGFAHQLALVDGLPLALALILAAGCAWLVCRREPGRILASFSASSLVLTLVLLEHGAGRLERHFSLKTLALAARSRLVPGENLVCYKSFYREALFYTQGRLEGIWTLEEVALRASERRRILALTELWRFEELSLAPSLEVELLEEQGGRVLAQLRPRPREAGP